ncbi:signal recognition particle-docking protein FtsY [Savagea sp. SN6]|uniref:Signal recognition particle receptor FtsY n=1 Tax=Savagea serpentis TaxID=2785297 RepID=A0A8J7KAY4_9BACL|nr:signal recognition particle-docking protein FtsY [Savagea serpentis]MBF4499912.1 signal recognition particle-docking protein FtsY [Savagea serpentis]
MSWFKKLKQKLTGAPETTEEQLVEDVVVEEKPELDQREESAVEQEEVEELEEVVEVEAEVEEQEEQAEMTMLDSILEDVPEDKKKEVEEEVSLFGKFKLGLAKTRDSFTSKINDLVAQFREVDEEFFEELEEVLLQADVGFETVMELIDELEMEVKRQNIKDTSGMQSLISEKLVDIYNAAGDDEDMSLNMQPEGETTVILMVGVNGVGKTTTIGKLAARFQKEGKTVMLAAGDTFRAGAIDQLVVWGERAGVEVIRQAEGSDPAAVMFDAIQAAKKRKVDVLICDTAGRLQNKVNLMTELEKIHRVIGRELPGAPHEVLLALDATTGQNALVQAETFKEATDVTGIVLTKLDGTAKGGIVLAIRKKMNIPVKFVGLGEGIDDLQPFDPDKYVYGLFADGLEMESVTEDK